MRRWAGLNDSEVTTWPQDYHKDVKEATLKDDLTTTQVAAYLGCNRDTAKRLIPNIPGAYKFDLTGSGPARNSPWRVSKAKLDEFILRRKYAVGSQKLAEAEARGYCDARR